MPQASWGAQSFSQGAFGSTYKEDTKERVLKMSAGAELRLLSISERAKLR